MKTIKVILLFIVLGFSNCGNQPIDEVSSVGMVDSWITTPNKSMLLKQQPQFSFSPEKSFLPTIVVDTANSLQSIDGFGYSLTGGSAIMLNKLSSEARSDLFKELFLTDNDGIGISYLRISIGASDLDENVFSYNDLPSGDTDIDLEKFSLDPDRVNLIPVLKEILQLRPSLKIMATPWSAPVWMKTNGLVKGGSLKPEYYDVYSRYFIRYIKEMAEEGINIDAITIQNEPEHPGNTPSMAMTSDQQNDFIKNHLGPAFRSNNIQTKIVIFDHNCDNPNYPISILNDPITKPMINGSAFHLYLGEISALSTVHNAHPDKEIYFTEQWTSGLGDFGGDLQWHVTNLIIGATRTWSRNVLEWNLAADENFDPHTDDGGCNLCMGALTINSRTNRVSRNVSYYVIAHASKFVNPESRRIGTNMQLGLSNVAFLTPEGKKVLIVLNENSTSTQFSINYKNQSATSGIPAGSVATDVW